MATITFVLGTIQTNFLFFPDNTYNIGQAGALRPRDLFLARNATIGGFVTLNGNLTWTTDATFDVGAVGATRPRDFFLSRNATIGGTLGVTGAATFSAVVSANLGVTISGAPLLFTADNTWDIGASGATRARDFFLGRNATIGGTLTVSGVGANLIATTGVFTVTGAVRFTTDAIYDIGQAGATRPRHLYLSGNAVVGGQLQLADGSVAAPGLGFSGDTSTGIWRQNAPFRLNFTLNGASTIVLLATAVYPATDLGLDLGVATTNRFGAVYVGGPIISGTDPGGAALVRSASGQFTTLTGTLATAAQPNVTSLGTLISVTITGQLSNTTGPSIFGVDPGGTRIVRVGGEIQLRNNAAIAFKNAAGTDVSFGQFYLSSTDTLRWFLNGGKLELSEAALFPQTAGILTLGTSLLPWGNLFLANNNAIEWTSSGGVAGYAQLYLTSVDVLNFFMNGAGRMQLTTAALSPVTAGLTLGTSLLPWGAEFLAGPLTWPTDNTYDIGASGATRPRDLFLGRNAIVGGTVRLKGYTVAGLPAGTQGDTAFVTDALAPTYLGVLAGGGAVVTPAFFNGANWLAM